MSVPAEAPFWALRLTGTVRLAARDRAAGITAGGVIAQVFAYANQAMQNAAAAGILAGVALLVAAIIMVVRAR